MKTDRQSKIILLAATLLATLVIGACDPTERAQDGYMLVFDYEGKFIPVEQLHKADADACDAEHWHGGGQVVTLRGETLSDPDPECGFGKDGDIPVREVLMADDYQGPQRTDPDFRFNARD
jgi:hypothetical protein